MTFDEMIERIKVHTEIHKKKEPQALLITEALNEAISLLENQRWHYPSKGELPGKDQRILFLLKEPYFGERLFLGSRFQFDDGFYIWQCCGDEHWSDDMVFAWRYPSELPKV